LLAVISGIYPRFTGILHWIITFSFQYASAIPDGGDQIAMILSLYFVPITVMDNRKNHFYTSIYQTSFQNSVSCLVTKFLIPLQMSIIYFHSAIEKLYKLEEWRNGTALYYILEDPLFGSSFFKKQIMNLFSSKYIVVPLTWGTVLIEILLFSALFMNYKNKKILFFIGTIFHFSIILFFGLFSFFFSMFSGLIVYLLNPSDNFRFFNFKKLPLIKSISKYKLNL
jgi:antimicrobial peptide system SdpB family protein